jgi:hypothetical protein
MHRSHVHRTATGVVRALVSRHQTFATFLSEPLDAGLQRWQMFVIVVTLVCSQLLVNIWCESYSMRAALLVPLACSCVRAPMMRRMFYARGVNCCAELRGVLDSGPDGGHCPADAAAACRGFAGDCAALAAQFAAVPVLPDYPAGLSDYTCHAFPDDDAPLDSFLVGLISIAVALPVTLFLNSFYSVANDADTPDSFLRWAGWRRLVFGLAANRRWHYTAPAGQPRCYARWHIRSGEEPALKTLLNLCSSAYAWLTCSDTPWVLEARHAEAAAAMADWSDDNGDDDGSDCAVASRRLDHRRAVAYAGLAGTYVIWAIFAWCGVAHVCGSASAAHPHAHFCGTP